MASMCQVLNKYLTRAPFSESWDEVGGAISQPSGWFLDENQKTSWARRGALEPQSIADGGWGATATEDRTPFLTKPNTE